MPQRFLKPGITNSDRWNRVSFQAQSLFIRLLTMVDDYGRCDGRHAVILGQCFSVWNANNPRHQIDLQQLSGFLQEIAASGLIETYVADDKSVLQITQWTERIRDGVKERWPCRKLQQNPAEKKASSSPSSSSSPPSSICTPPPELALTGEQIKRVNGIPPDPKDVHDYGLSIGLVADQSDAFIDHHESRGWMLGKVKMRDWKAALRTWKRNGKQFNQNNHAHIRNHRQSGPDRNAGTYNADAPDYSRLVKRSVPRVQNP